MATTVLEVELLPSELDKSLLEESLELFHGSQYADLRLATFEGDIDMNGNKAVYYAFYGKDTDGKERLVHVVLLFNADLTGQYIITLLHSAEEEIITPEAGEKIIKSITLAKEAQNLAAETEN